MKFFHLADLHFGKSVYGISMIGNGDQPYWADRFLELCDRERPDAVVIAGDVYDRSAPSAEAVALLDRFLTELAERNIPVMAIAGNHDSGQRLSFGSTLLAKQNIHIAGLVKEEIDHVTLDDPDGNGPVTFWLLPYLFPEQVSVLLGDETIRTYQDAAARLIAMQDIDRSRRNVIVSHQNVTAGGQETERGGSESMVGGVGQIDYSVYDDFDYAALGHIHSFLPVGRNEVRYAGTPLCYHLDETRRKEKGALLVELGAKGEPVRTSLKVIEPLHRMRHLKGTREEIYSLLESDEGKNEYIGISITDRRIDPETAAYLRKVVELRGSVLAELRSLYLPSAEKTAAAAAGAVRSRPVEDLFADLYTEQKGGIPPADDEYELMRYIGEMVRSSDPHEPVPVSAAEKILAYAAGLEEEDR